MTEFPEPTRSRPTDQARRVLQLVHSAEPGGVQTLAAEIARGLEAAGMSVTTRYLFPHARAGTVEKLAGTVATVFAMMRARYDVVIAYQSTASLLAGIIGRLAGCPWRIVHQTALPSEVRPLLRGLDRLVGSAGLYTANVVNSAATKAAFAGYPGGYRRALVRIDHGVATPQPRAGRAETWAQYGVPYEGLLLLNVGRLTSQKNQSVLIRALARIPTARLVVAGGGPLEADYRTLADELGVAERLHLLGDVPREAIADLYGAADLFVFPSRWETFGLAAVEAALAGLPVIASDLAVLREVLGSNEDGAATFVAWDEVEAWTAALSDRSHSTQVTAETNPDRLRRRYSLDRMIASYLGLLARDERPARKVG